MLVSILIATRNRCAALRQTLRALGAVGRPAGLDVEVLVVDNGSTDETRSEVKSCRIPLGPVWYFSELTRGKSTALNAALAVARGDILVFIDDDVWPEVDWLRQITAPMTEGRTDAVAGAVRIAPHLLRPWMKSAHLAWLASTNDLDPAQPQSAVGANMAIARHVLSRVPRFDPELGPGRLGFWEDTLFASQVLRAGYRLAFAGDAMVEHHFDPSRLLRRSFLEHAKGQGRSHAYVHWHWAQAARSETSRYALGYRLRLAAKRLTRRHDCNRIEGIAMWEMDLTCGIAFADQLRVEQRRPRSYARFGTIPLTPFIPALLS